MTYNWTLIDNDFYVFRFRNLTPFDISGLEISLIFEWFVLCHHPAVRLIMQLNEKKKAYPAKSDFLNILTNITCC